MLSDLSEAAAKCGLHVHFGKTKVMTTQQNGGEMQGIKFDDKVIQILRLDEGERYLGRQLGVHHSTEAEIEQILKGAWAAFMKCKSELCSKHYCLRHRLRLFDSVVTPVACFGSCAWTMTKHLEQRLQVTQRKMLRMVLGFRRHADIDWIEFMQKSTDALEMSMVTYGVRRWVAVQRKCKWQFLGKTAVRGDRRWSTRILQWRPAVHGGRRVGAPCKRWGDDIDAYIGDDWISTARDGELWRILEDTYVDR